MNSHLTSITDWLATLSDAISLRNRVVSLEEKLEGLDDQVYDNIDLFSKECNRRRDLQDQVVELQEKLVACRKELAKVMSSSGVQPRKKKVPKPKEYDGSRDARHVDNFFWHMERYFDDLNILDEEKNVKIQPCTSQTRWHYGGYVGSMIEGARWAATMGIIGAEEMRSQGFVICYSYYGKVLNALVRKSTKKEAPSSSSSDDEGCISAMKVLNALAQEGKKDEVAKRKGKKKKFEIGWKGKANFIVIDIDNHTVVLGMDFMDKANAAPMPHLGAMMLLKKDGQPACMVPMVPKVEGSNIGLNTLACTNAWKLSYGECKIEP
ncbi:hypothetical protein F0562_023900 [Nyssa sinensis]|uniref:Uncharacterized protein n=1 Tax=Nyssa sinensis TaxID=561372 RepID=A0A5J5BJG3_9ASTE|nr:hypothetical protein F0562_023900 [Nyssa sinensis]